MKGLEQPSPLQKIDTSYLFLKFSDVQYSIKSLFSNVILAVKMDIVQDKNGMIKGSGNINNNINKCHQIQKGKGVAQCMCCVHSNVWRHDILGNIFSGGRVLQIPRAKVEDAGRYTCVAVNEAGEDSLQYDVHVLCKLAFVC